MQVTLIDVRDPSEYAAGHIEGARNIPHSQIEARAAEIARDHPQVFYCIHSSWRAPYAANAFADLGFENVYVLEGGVSAWHAGGQAIYSADPGREPAVAPYPEGLPRVLVHPPDREHDGTLELTAEELSEYDGLDGRPAYVALDGVVYDVTASRLWRGGRHDPSHGAAQAGQDLTKVFAEAPHDRDNLKRFPVVGRLVERRDPSP
jgi:predicted heme/steroid binding protein/rhodanese-related sulfurtransferase